MYNIYAHFPTPLILAKIIIHNNLTIALLLWLLQKLQKLQSVVLWQNLHKL